MVIPLTVGDIILEANQQLPDEIPEPQNGQDVDQQQYQDSEQPQDSDDTQLQSDQPNSQQDTPPTDDGNPQPADQYTPEEMSVYKYILMDKLFNMVTALKNNGIVDYELETVFKIAHLLSDTLLMKLLSGSIANIERNYFNKSSTTKG